MSEGQTTATGTPGQSPEGPNPPASEQAATPSAASGAGAGGAAGEAQAADSGPPTGTGAALWGLLTTTPQTRHTLSQLAAEIGRSSIRAALLTPTLLPTPNKPQPPKNTQLAGAAFPCCCRTRGYNTPPQHNQRAENPLALYFPLCKTHTDERLCCSRKRELYRAPAPGRRGV